MESIKLKAGQVHVDNNFRFTAPVNGVYTISSERCIHFKELTQEDDTRDIAQKCDEVLNWVREKYNLTDSECDDIYLAGGCIRSLTLGEDVRDYDIFVTGTILKDKLVRLAKENSYGYVSDNAITHYSSFGQIQIITTATGYPWDIVAEFDFVMNQNYYYKYLATLGDNPLKIGCRDTILAKKLTINQNCRNKLGTLARLVKFMERGYLPPSKADMIALGIAISKLNPITNLTELVSESKLYLNVDEVSTLCDGEILATCTDEEFEALNNRGSGL